MLTYRTIQGNPLWLTLIALTPVIATLSLTTVVMADAVMADQSTQAEANSAAQPEDSDSVATSKELQVAPLDQVEYPKDRPKWIDEGPDLEGETHCWVAVSTPCDSPTESDESLELMQRVAVELYAKEFFDSKGLDGAIALSHDWIDQNVDRLVAKHYAGELTQGDMQLYESAAQLQFSPQIQNELREQWKNQEVTRRLGMLGFLGFVGTVLLGCGSATLGIFSRRVERQDQPEVPVT